MDNFKANIFLGEVLTDGHSTMKFLCQDGNLYYCKYRVNTKVEELDCLVYEVLCSRLLKFLDIPTPDIALIELLPNTFTSKDFRKNRLFAKPGVYCFGSKEVKNANLITGLELVGDSESLNLFHNPYDFLKIAVFDLWINNADRGRNNNYNLLVSDFQGKLKVWAFDHAFAFGGLNDLRIFNSKTLPSVQGKLFSTTYFKTLLPLLDQDKCLETVSILIDKMPDSLRSTIECLNELPLDWMVFPRMKLKIEEFLLDSGRIEVIRQLVITQLGK